MVILSEKVSCYHIKTDYHFNHLFAVPDIKSDSLLSLDLSNTKLTTLQNSVFAYLPSLSYVNLSKNHRLALVGKTDQVESDSVKRLDLSYCKYILS